jgi:hypothetical protein
MAFYPLIDYLHNTKLGYQAFISPRILGRRDKNKDPVIDAIQICGPLVFNDTAWSIIGSHALCKATKDQGLLLCGEDCERQDCYVRLDTYDVTFTLQHGGKLIL